MSSELGLPQASLSLTFPISETTLLSPTDLLPAQEIPDMSLNLLWSLSVNSFLQFPTSCRGTTEPQHREAEEAGAALGAVYTGLVMSLLPALRPTGPCLQWLLGPSS